MVGFLYNVPLPFLHTACPLLILHLKSRAGSIFVASVFQEALRLLLHLLGLEE